VAFIEVVKDNLIVEVKKSVLKVKATGKSAEAALKAAAKKSIDAFIISVAFVDLVAEKFVSFVRDKANQIDAKLHLLATSVVEDYVRSKAFIITLKSRAKVAIKEKIKTVEDDVVDGVITSVAFVAVIKDHLVEHVKRDLAQVRVGVERVELEIKAIATDVLNDIIFGVAFIDYICESFIDFVKDKLHAINVKVKLVAKEVAHDFVSSVLFVDYLKDKVVAKSKSSLSYFEVKIYEELIYSVAFLEVIEDHLALLIENALADAKDLSDDALRRLANKILKEFIESVSFIDYVQTSITNSIVRRVEKLKNWSQRESSWLTSIKEKAASYIH